MLRKYIKIYSAVMCLLMAGCASSNQLVFFTNTTLGIDIGSNATSGNAATLVVGYKRQEGVIDPIVPKYTFIAAGNSGVNQPQDGNTAVVTTPNGTAVPDGTATQAHSVLAKINFGANTGVENASSVQWFATGKAAELIAQSPTAAQALTGDTSTAGQKVVIATGESLAAFGYLNTVYAILKSAEQDTSPPPGIAAIQVSVDKLDGGDFRKPLKVYSYTGLDGVAGKCPKPKTIKSDVNSGDFDFKDPKDFSQVITYLSNMKSSIDTLKFSIANSTVTLCGSPLSDKDRQTMLDALQDQQARYDAGVQTVSSNQDVIKMLNFVTSDVMVVKTASQSKQ